MADALDFTEKQSILVVDDTPDNLTLMTGLLKDEYRTKVANNGERALKVAATLPHPDLILLDIMMPGMDGYEVCQRLKADPATAEIPVIFLTAKTEVEDEQKGFDVGCVDYVTKPISPPIVLARVKTHLLLKSARDFLKDQNAYLEAEVERRTKEVQVVQDTTIMAMGSLAETRDNETGNHIRRTQHYVRVLADKLKVNPAFAKELDEHTIELLFKSAPLHDIGKVGIPDGILLKPGKLTPEEFEIMKTHTTLGRDAIQLLPALRARDRLLAPGEMGRFRLSRGARGAADTALRAIDGGGGRVRRAHQQARLQTSVPAREGGRDHPRGQGKALRPRDRGRLRGSDRRIPQDRGGVRGF
jgi:putative two-component system response regulator